LLVTSLGICVYYTPEYPPIGLVLPIAAALFSVAEAGHLRIGIVVSVILVGLAVYFQIIAGRNVGQLLGYELPPVIALMAPRWRWAMEHGRDGSSNSPNANGSARPSWNSSAVRPNSGTKSGCDWRAIYTMRLATRSRWSPCSPRSRPKLCRSGCRRHSMR
jgi:hypothetical protein